VALRVWLACLFGGCASDGTGFEVYGATVGWTASEYAVTEGDFRREVQTVLCAAWRDIDRAYEHLTGPRPIVSFREPGWNCVPREDGTPGPWGDGLSCDRGKQIGRFIDVGWREPLSETALKHELGHLILWRAGVHSEAQHEVIAGWGF